MGLLLAGFALRRKASLFIGSVYMIQQPLFHRAVTLSELESFLWEAANILRDIPVEWWAVIMIVVPTVIVSAVSITRGDSAYVAVIVWAFVGIALKHSDTLIVTVAAWAATVFVALTLLIGVPHTQGRLRDLSSRTL
jgi:hypothetical protein